MTPEKEADKASEDVAVPSAIVELTGATAEDMRSLIVALLDLPSPTPADGEKADQAYLRALADAVGPLDYHHLQALCSLLAKVRLVTVIEQARRAGVRRDLTS
jgi:hypothetical protein